MNKHLRLRISRPKVFCNLSSDISLTRVPWTEKQLQVHVKRTTAVMNRLRSENKLYCKVHSSQQIKCYVQCPPVTLRKEIRQRDDKDKKCDLTSLDSQGKKL